MSKYAVIDSAIDLAIGISARKGLALASDSSKTTYRLMQKKDAKHIEGYFVVPWYNIHRNRDAVKVLLSALVEWKFGDDE
jgi:hypothetical protein